MISGLLQYVLKIGSRNTAHPLSAKLRQPAQGALHGISAGHQQLMLQSWSRQSGGEEQANE
jgi:hypothetical protein